MVFKGEKIIFGVTGSIAAYKSAYLIRLLVKEGADVMVIMTPSSKDFITPLTLSSLSNNPVLCESFVPVTGKWNSHVEFGMWADLMLIAPLSANTMAKMANGIADNLLLTTYLSARCPVFFAPAMDLEMYNHPATQKNIKTLCADGNILISPAEGELASGLYGCGRMEEPENIVKVIKEHFSSNNIFQNKTVLVTAGPTHEKIDAVRYIGNNSSGLMGFCLAEEFASKGANVILITGPTNLEVKNKKIKRIDVISSGQMYEKCSEYFEKTDITVMAAAVADYTYKDNSQQKLKIKKELSSITITLEPTIDILKELGKRKTGNQILVGFALETENEIENAINKLKSKNLDLIILNSLNDKGAGFNHETNKIAIIDKTGNIVNNPLKSKIDVAKDIVTKISGLIKK
jgi:phosphopantothenoylcysteine decarboxylase / phosphopantothenate---cysteine ligase